MPLNDTGSLLGRQIRAAVNRHRYGRRQRDETIRDIEATLIRLEIDDPGLIQNIEDRLANRRSYPGSREQQLLNLAIASVVGAGPNQRRRRRTEPLAGRDFTHHECVMRSAQNLSQGSDPAEVIERIDWEQHEQETLERAIDAFPERMRKILRAVYVDGKSQAEVARDLGIPTSTLNDAIQKVIGSLNVRMQHLRAKGTDG